MAKEAGIKIVIDNAEAKRQLEELTTEFKSLKKNREQAFKTGNIDAFKTYDKELKKTGSQIRKLENDTISVERTMRNINKVSYSDLQKALKVARKEMQGLDRDSELYKQKFKNYQKIKSEVDKVNGSFREQGGLFSKLSGGFNKYFGMVAAGIASLTGVMMGLKSSIQDAFDFETAQANLSALTGLKGEELDWLSEKAKELSTSVTADGVRITQSAEEILKAFQIMGSAKGELLGDKEAMAQVTEQALVLAKAAGMETAPAVESLAVVMNQFGAKADEATRYVNALAAGSQAGAAEVDDIANSMKRFGPVANMANVSVEESVALLEVLAEKGIKAEVAGTGLRSVLLRLQKGSDEFNPKVVGMSKALHNLKEANLDVTEQQKLFGTTGVVIGNNLMENAEMFDKFTTSVTGTNTAIEQATITTGTNQAMLDQQKNKIKLVSIELGQKLSPVMTGTMGIFTKFMKVLLVIIETYQKHSKIINTTVAAMITYAVVTKANTLWTKAFSAAKLKDVIADKLSIMWLNAKTIATSLYNLVTARLTGNAKKASVAVKALNNTMKGSGWAIALSAIVAIGVALYQWSTSSTAAGKALKSLKEAEVEARMEAYKQKQAIDELVAVAKDETKSKRDREKAIKDLNAISPEYLGNITLENVATSDAKDILEKYNEVLLKTAKIKAAKAKLDELAEREMKLEVQGTGAELSIMQKTWAKILGTLTGDANVALTQEIKSLSKNYEGEMEQIKRERESLKKYIDKNEITTPEKTDPVTSDDGLELDETEEERQERLAKKNKTKTEWTLESDRVFLEKRLELKKQYQLGEIETQEEYAQQLLALEISSLQDRLLLNKDSKEVLAKIGEQWIDKNISENERRNAANKKADEDDSKSRKEYIEGIQSNYEKTLALMKLHNNEELALIQTLDAAKKVLSETLTADELAEITNLYDAKEALKKQNQKKEAAITQEHAQNLLAIFKKIAESGEIEGIDLSNKILSPEEVELLEERIIKIREQLADLKNAGEKEDKKEGKSKAIGVKGIDVFGFSPEDWEQLFVNLESGKIGIGEMAMAANALLNVWSDYNEMVANGENKQMKEFSKNQDSKKEALDRRLEQGRISQIYYDATIRSIDEQTDAKKEALMKKQAKRERDVALLSAIVNTAASAIKALGIMPPPVGIALAALIAAAGGVQIAKIASTDISGAESGGAIMDVIRSQDGKKFRAINEPTKRGMISRPTVLTGEENKPEYVIPYDGVKNPSVRRIINVLEMARQSGSLSSINIDAVQSSMPGFQSGGYVDRGNTNNSSIKNGKSTTMSMSNSNAEYALMMGIMSKLEKKLDQPLFAYTTIKGTGGLEEKQKEYETLIKNAGI